MRAEARAGIDHVSEAFARRRGPAVFTFLLLATVTLGLVKGLPNVYSASATILVEPPRGLETAAPEEVQARLQLFTQQIQGRERLVDLIQRHGLYASLRAKLSDADITERMRHDIRLELRGPEQGGRSVVAFSVSYRSVDPSKAAAVANALTDMYLAEDARQRGGLVEALSAQLGDIKARLDQQEHEVGAFQDRYKGELPQQLEVNMATAQRLEAQLRVVAEARVRATERRSSLMRQTAEERPASPDPGGREAQLEGLRRQLAELQRAYTDRYPDVEKLKQQIAALEAQPAASAARPAETAPSAYRAAINDADQEIKSLAEEEQRLQAEAREYRRRVEGAPRLQQDFREKERDHETTRGLYNALLKRLQESQLSATEATSGAGYGLRLLDHAVPPQYPVAPKRLQLAVLGLILALSAAAAVVALFEKADSSFHSVKDLRDFTRVPVLAAISVVGGTRQSRQALRLRVLVTTAAVLSLVLVGQLSLRVARSNPDLLTLMARVR